MLFSESVQFEFGKIQKISEVYREPPRRYLGKHEETAETDPTAVIHDTNFAPFECYAGAIFHPQLVANLATKRRFS